MPSRQSLAGLSMRMVVLGTWSLLGLDLVGPAARSPDSFRFLLVVVASSWWRTLLCFACAEGRLPVVAGCCH